MITTFLSHGFKRFFRSASVGREIATRIALGFIAVVLAGYSVAAGFMLETIIVNVLKQSDAVYFLNGLLIYYFIAEFVMRYFFQSLPTLDVQPYLHLPIARSRIVHFLSGKSLVNVINIFVFLLFTPFAMNAVANAYGASQAWVWLLSIWLVSVANHFSFVLFKKNLDDNVWGLVAFMAVAGVVAASDYLGWFSLSAVSANAFGIALHGYTSIGVLILVVALLYMINYRFFIDRLYPEELSVQESHDFRSANLGFLQNFGLTGTWITVELKLILRHKRTRSVLFMSLLVLAYLLFMYTRMQQPDALGFFLFVGILGTGIFAINYGQFLFSWQGKHFDFTLTQPTTMRLFVESKYWLLASTTGLWFLLSIPFVYFGWNIVLANFVCALYNVGVNTFILMNMAMWSPKSIDLSRGGTLNYEGVGAAQWLMGIPVLLSPYVFYLPFSLMGFPVAGLVAVGLTGLTGIVFRKQLTEITSRRLSSKRYAIASNFRKD